MDNRRPLIAGNWKMYKTCFEAVETVKEIVPLVGDISKTDIMVAPPFIALAPVSEILRGSNVGLGAQNLFWEDQGAFTGEISPGMLKSTGCQYAIIGHSERRQYFNETDATVNKRIKAAVTNGLIPILCVGETENERDSNNTLSVLDKQITNGLQNYNKDELNKLVIAYEPVWAIGTGKTATSDLVQEVHLFLRSLIGKIFGSDFAELIRILYGGSVKPNNIASLMMMPDIDGALVGGASLDADTFSRIVHYQ